MSNASSRFKAIKRRLSDHEDTSYKRSRVQESKTPRTTSRAPSSKNLAARRLARLREDIKNRPLNSSKLTAQKKLVQGLINNNEQVRSTLPKRTCQSGDKGYKSPSKRSVNDRLKISQRQRSDNDETIIVIDNSPDPIKGNRSFSSSRSFIVVSEASNSQRGHRLDRQSSSGSSSKTLTPENKSPPSKGLRIPLKRNLAKTISKEEASAPDPVASKVVRPNEPPLNKSHIFPIGKKSSPVKPLPDNDSPRSKLSDRLKKIRNTPAKDPANNVRSPKINESVPLDLPQCPKQLLVRDWMGTVPEKLPEQPTDDSLMVNVDDTLLNKSEIFCESQDEDDSMEWEDIIEQVSSEDKREKVTCIVTDTNVFMHNLTKIKDIINLNLKIKVFVPWMVLQELDHLKDHSPMGVKSIALAAQKFINKHLTHPDSKIIGQSVDDVCQQQDLGKSPDDKILACCLQACKKYSSVILLTNDINLCNKAISNDIKAYNPKDILSKLKGGKCLKIKVRLQILLSQIIFQSCKDAFGDAWIRMDMLQGCPWPFEGCLKRFKKYWSTVFDQLLLKQCRKTIDELIILTDKDDMMDSNSLNFKKFKDRIKEFLFYLQDIQQYSEHVKNARKEIDRIIEEETSVS